jgi:organic radical activating enzyme
MPWNNVSVDPDGSIKPCCISKDYIKKPDGTKYNLGYDKIEDFYNSPDYVSIREKMLKGELVPGCTQCIQNESYGKESKRITTNKRYQHSLNKASAIANPDIEYFDLRFGNLCNLKCRSCTPINSSQLDKQVIENPELQKYYHNFGYNINEWYETETFQENVFSNLKKLNTLYITGGEPTIIKKNFELLERLIEEGYSKNILLVINSNMTNDKSTFFDLISHFKEVIFFASIDGYNDMQEYLRYPSDWNQISKNLENLVSKNYTNVNIRVAPVIQITNIGTIIDLFEYCEEFNRKADRSAVDIFLNNLEYPDYLNSVNLPNKYKLECWDRIEDWVQKRCTYQKPLFHSQLEALKNKCLIEVEYKEVLGRFFDFNSLVDKRQKLTLHEINPELAQLQYK